jgi:hypothetical protein
LIDAFQNPLMKLTKDPKSKLSEQDVKDIFCNLGDIQNVTTELLKRCEASFEDFPATPIGSIFDQKVSLFEFVLFVCLF